LRPAGIAAHELEVEGNGDRAKAPTHLIAVLGDSKLLQPYVLRKPATTSPRGHTRPVTGVSFSPDGKRLASCSEDRTIVLWDCVTSKPLKQLTRQAAYLNSVAFSPDGKRLVSTAQEIGLKSGQTLMLWDATSGKELEDISGTRLAASATFSPDSKWLAYCSNDLSTHSIRVRDAAGKRQLLSLDGYGGEFMAVTFSPDGTRLAAGGGTGVFIWDLASGEDLALLSGHIGRVSSVAFSPDGQLLASADTQMPSRMGNKFDVPQIKPTSVKIWNANTGKEVRSLDDGFDNGAYSVAFSPDGKRLATAGIRQPVRVWDVASGKELFSLGAAKRVAHMVQFSPDGRHLAVGDERGVVCIYRLEEKP
jgi:WD40 repeat protein